MEETLEAIPEEKHNPNKGWGENILEILQPESLFDLQDLFWDRKQGIDKTPVFRCKVVHTMREADTELLDYVKQRRKNDHQE